MDEHGEAADALAALGESGANSHIAERASGEAGGVARASTGADDSPLDGSTRALADETIGDRGEGDGAGPGAGPPSRKAASDAQNKRARAEQAHLAEQAIANPAIATKRACRTPAWLLDQTEGTRLKPGAGAPRRAASRGARGGGGSAAACGEEGADEGEGQEAGSSTLLNLGDALASQLAAQSVAFFHVELPAELKFVSIQLFGCPAAGSDNVDVKAFISLDKPQLTQWDAQWSVSWCAARPLIVPREELPAGRHTMHISVYAQGSAAYEISVYDVPKLELGEARTHTLNCSSKEIRLTPPSVWREHQYLEGGQLAPLSMCAGFSLEVPAGAAQALYIRLALKDTPADGTSVFRGPGFDARSSQSQLNHLYSSCHMHALLSFTASNLIAFPSSYGLRVGQSDGKLKDSVLIPRTSPAVCKLEPCKLTLLIATGGSNPGCGKFGDRLLEISVEEADAPPPSYELESIHGSVLDVIMAQAHDPNNDEELKSSDLRPQCAPGCEQDFVSDGVCDEACFTRSCLYDEYDCEWLMPKNRASGLSSWMSFIAESPLLASHGSRKQSMYGYAPPPPAPLGHNNHRTRRPRRSSTRTAWKAASTGG
jgi:hypothetical protein